MFYPPFSVELETMESDKPVYGTLMQAMEVVDKALNDIQEEYDLMTLVKDKTIKCLDDGFVRLRNVSPRMAPKGRTAEFAIVESARVSFGRGLKSIVEDEGLIEYVMTNGHTSTLEDISFGFHIRAPIFVLIHFLRHRTWKFNMNSQRYAEVEHDSYYHLSSKVETMPEEGGIRLQSKTNKQSSDKGEVNDDILKSVAEAEKAVDSCIEAYHKMIKLGVAKELARFCLPTAMYSELYATVDLNNLLKFLTLRADKHAQAETRVYAEAMIELIKPIIPSAMRIWEDQFNGMKLSASEMACISGEKPFTSKSKLVLADSQKKMQKIHDLVQAAKDRIGEANDK